MRTLKLILTEEEPAVSMEWEINTALDGFPESLGAVYKVMERAFEEDLAEFGA